MSNSERILSYINKVDKVWLYAAKDMMDHIDLIFYIISLKGLIDGSIYSDLIEISDLENIAGAFKPNCSDDDIHNIANASALIEKGFGLQPGFMDIMSEYIHSSDYIRIIKDLLSVTADLDLEDNEYSELVTCILYYASKSRSYMIREKTSRDAMASTLKVAADVNDRDNVLYGAVGYGYCTLKCISGRDNINLTGIDRDIHSLQVFSLYMIICGKQFEICAGDFTSMVMDKRYDKIIMDPFVNGYNITELTKHQIYLSEKWTGTKTCKKYYIYCIANALESMKENGRIIIIVPRRFLSVKIGDIAFFRKNIIRQELLKAVVLLPKIHISNSIEAVMLIFEKNNKDVLFFES